MTGRPTEDRRTTDVTPTNNANVVDQFTQKTTAFLFSLARPHRRYRKTPIFSTTSKSGTYEP
ncbi:hypothetical protein EJ06DRAFT_529813 [Trichodelitschia bisporula]|uniref:Uncharacterized protein n=1 Tax=Trichodelitschia bisporula TaxID=703511 RepID=A0A6G1HXV1_9PEZI|nr:hypothetical protein EJ06DRAFT_529813 [Trichodelitschia bisporula]